ncbi:hypothetical protein PUNSTDRAFT_136359 [Punctularia strigosozonata HHB-11173 SS5]|uniref:uncharacterized protein n=1 Tax=Punctularia strigosozonata (strain HHB-11173) TaxID=741275 RepID=UPI0004417790|nr:uncharacterized protein PUNSTDRAFT_136359 [Punctularia strigosozonata HHB-11173 SS5]EIN06500.1 hypothetical protein PUNSTDRAFT_136359 [Punctularia strigosozonata HHB-11173 SS5]
MKFDSRLDNNMTSPSDGATVRTPPSLLSTLLRGLHVSPRSNADISERRKRVLRARLKLFRSVTRRRDPSAARRPDLELEQLDGTQIAAQSCQKHAASVNNLPVELLSMIFQFWVSDDRSPSSYSSLKCAVAHVCKQWRHVALDTPSLWNLVDLGRPLLAQKLLDHCRHPIHLVWKGATELSGDMETLLSHLRQCPERIQAITLDGSPELLDAVVKSAFANLPSTRTLSIVSDDKAHDHDLVSIRGLETPALECLEIEGFVVPWTCPMYCSSNLRTLCIWRNHDSPTSLTLVLDCFEHLQSLEVLRWSNALPEDSLGSPPGENRIIHMPSLLVVELSGTCSGCTALLSHISREYGNYNLSIECSDVSVDLYPSLWTTAEPHWLCEGRRLAGICIETTSYSLDLRFCRERPSDSSSEDYFCSFRLPVEGGKLPEIMRALGPCIAALQSPVFTFQNVSQPLDGVEWKEVIMKCSHTQKLHITGTDAAESLVQMLLRREPSSVLMPNLRSLSFQEVDFECVRRMGMGFQDMLDRFLHVAINQPPLKQLRLISCSNILDTESASVKMMVPEVSMAEGRVRLMGSGMAQA